METNGQNGGKEIKFGTFGGVFTPSVLTIVGVILFLRTGWLVGNTGLVAAIIIILIAHSVTVSTGLSLSSIITNIRIGAGGAYSIIAQSLGLEVGGAIGIPLYLSQSISVAFYIAGFTEAWVNLFPGHDARLVAVISWAAIAIISYIGAHWALRVQYIVMAAIAVSLISFFIGKPHEPVTPRMWGEFSEGNFWKSFAIFFPAVTGIRAGINMSGDLRNPRRAIPYGTLMAIGVGFVVYLATVVVIGFRADTATLLENMTIMADASTWGVTFYIGVFAATLSSALALMVGAPRTLAALGEHGVIPMSQFLGRMSARGQPRNATIITGAISLVFILMGTLDSIAQLLTMIFLITYGMVNSVTFLEQVTGIVSFRPSFRIPIFVPLYGAIACLLIMLVINPIMGVLALVITSLIYMVLVRAGLKTRWGDVRSGVFSSIAAWAARQAVHLPRHEKSWTPDLLLPLEDPGKNTELIKFSRDISYPGGTVIAFSVTMEDRKKKLAELNEALMPIRKDKMFFISSVVEGTDFVHEAKTIIQLIHETFFRPNVLLLTLSDDPSNDGKIHEIIDTAIEERMGVAILKRDPKRAFKFHRIINLILRDKSPNKNLAILLSLQLQRNWNASNINLVSIAEDEHDYASQNAFFKHLSEEARFPIRTSINVIKGHFPDDLSKMPACDIAIFGLGQHVSTTQIRSIYTHAGMSCLFIRDSGFESAFV